MPVTSIRMSSAPARPVPKAGDRRTTKKHGLQIRIPERVQGGYHVDSRGRPYYVWCKLADLPPRYRHYLTAEERAAIEQTLEAA